jgi:Protein of unknown function (DUF1592)/Protein of unknown function (DUF1588)/Protein of unknown function (DUF1595)/Protein of unknown function (DUF1585)
MRFEPRSNERVSRRLLPMAAAWVLTSAGCAGDIGGPAGSVADAPGGGSDTAAAGASSGLVNGRVPVRVWRLTTPQVNAELRALFGEGVPSVDLREGAAEHHLTNVAANAGIDVGNVDNLVNGARTVASWVVANGAAATRCGASYGNAGCIDSLLAWLPAAAYKRPVAEEELAALRAMFEALRAQYDFDVALGTVVRSVLMSPDFVYRTELGSAAASVRGPVRLTSHEIATLLAYAITDRAPDGALLDAAARGVLEDADEREAQARRLMTSSGVMWRRFFWEWLHMETFDSQAVEVGLSAALSAQMLEEYRAFMDDVIVTQSGGLEDVFGASHTFARAELATHYGASHPGGGVTRVELDPAQRGGLLTRGAWLVAHGKAGRDNVVRRGMNVFREAMCHEIRPPTGVDVNAELAKLVGPGASVKETVEARGETGSCAGCHRTADPVGLAFESFTSDGRFQATYPDGHPVESAVELPGVGSFDNARDLSVALTESPEFRACFVRRFSHFMLGREVGGPAEISWLGDAARRAEERGDALAELLISLVRDPAFIEREQ